jgi:hypothetical protein
VLVLEDVLSLMRLWVIVSDISRVFLKTELQVLAGLTDISWVEGITSLLLNISFTLCRNVVLGVWLHDL